MSNNIKDFILNNNMQDHYNNTYNVSIKFDDSLSLR